MPDPYRCPLCGAGLVVAVDGVASCPRCRFRADHPAALRLWEVDTELERLGARQAQLVEGRAELVRELTPEAAVPGPVEAVAGAPVAQPGEPVPGSSVVSVRRAPSVQAVLVGLGAFLLVVAAVVFAAVTWERLGAAGQAAVLVMATAVAVATTWLAARRRLVATGEALSVVVAGFALVDVHAARVALDPPDAQLVWVPGLVLVAVGLVALGGWLRLRAPGVVAALVAQAPLVVAASLVPDGVVWMGLALLATSVADVGAALARPRAGRWIPAPAAVLCLVLAPVTWVAGAASAAGADPWPAVVLLGVATAAAVAAALLRAVPRVLQVTAAVGAVLSGSWLVVAACIAVGVEEWWLALVALAVPLGVLGGSWWHPAGRTDRVDGRWLAVRITAVVWWVAALAPWVEAIGGAMAAPLVALEDTGWWWTTAASGTASSLPPVAGPDRPPIGLQLAAVVLGAWSVAVVIAVFWRRRAATVRWLLAALAALTWFLAAAVVLAGWDVPLWAAVAVELLAAGGLVLVAVLRPDPAAVAVAFVALPVWVSGLGWAGQVDLLTVAVVVATAIVLAVAAGAALRLDRRVWSTVATVLATGVALPAAAATTCAALGLTPVGVWLAALASVLVASAVATVGDRRAPWWALTVDVTVLVTAGGLVVGLATVADLDQFSVAAGAVAATAALHALRPGRRWVAAGIAVGAALVVVWCQLWDGGVRTVEAYTLPPAAVLLGVGARRLATHPGQRSWPALGPGLALAAVPSVAVALGGTAVVRPLMVLAAAVAVTVVGAVLRLRAPLVVGAVVTAVMGVDQLWPYAERLPRWLLLGAAGVFLVAVGATFERRRRQAAAAFHRYQRLR